MVDPVKAVEVPAWSGASIEAKSGQFVRLVDVEGSQIGDLFAVARDDHDEFISPAVTRLYGRRLFPRVGEGFWSTRDRVMLTFVADDSPGFHDMLFGSCCDAWYAGRGKPNHPNCRDNYFTAARAAGIDHRVQPDPVNIFQNTPPTPDGGFFVGVTMTEPGDSVTLKAEVDCIVIVTACSSERVLAGKSTPMRLELHDTCPQ